MTFIYDLRLVDVIVVLLNHSNYNNVTYGLLIIHGVNLEEPGSVVARKQGQ